MYRFILILFFSYYIYAEGVTLLHPHKESIKKQTKDEIEAIYESEKNDWISPINLSLSTSKSTDSRYSKKAGASFSQDIYRFGGIRYQISYAKANRKYKLTNLKLEDSSYHEAIYNYILEIRKIKLQLKQASYQLQNKDLEIRIEKSKYKSGSGDITLLNRAIMDKNTQLQSMISLKNSRLNYERELYKITPIREYKIALPRFKLISKGNFIENNYAIKLSKMQQNIKKEQLNLTKSAYYPKVRFNSEVGYQEIENYGVTQVNDNYYSLGVSITIPIDFNRKSNIESKKLAYLKERLNEVDKRVEQKAIYSQIIQTIGNYRSYQAITRENIKLYSDILKSTKKGFKVGYKSGYDYKIIKNTYAIHKLDLKLYDIYIQQELLKLHFAIERG